MPVNQHHHTLQNAPGSLHQHSENKWKGSEKALQTARPGVTTHCTQCVRAPGPPVGSTCPELHRGCEALQRAGVSGESQHPHPNAAKLIPKALPASGMRGHLTLGACKCTPDGKAPDNVGCCPQEPRAWTVLLAFMPWCPSAALAGLPPAFVATDRGALGPRDPSAWSSWSSTCMPWIPRTGYCPTPYPGKNPMGWAAPEV